MHAMTTEQREAIKRIYDRSKAGDFGKVWPYDFDRFCEVNVEPGPGCLMVSVGTMWLGVEPDGYTHS